MICSFEDFKKEMKDGAEYSAVEDLEPAQGMCVSLTFTNSSQNAEIVWLDRWNTATLVHEITHLVMACFEECRVPISRDNSESFAFYTEYWWTQFNRARKKWPNGNSPKDAKT